MELNRRRALAALGAIGAAATAAAGQVPEALPAGPAVRRHRGVFGRLTGARAAADALRVERTRCVFGVPGAQNNEFWDAMKTHEVPYLLVTNESSASVMADAAARATGEVGVFSVIPGPGLTNALTGIGEALYDSVPIVGLVTDVLRGPNAPVGQVHGLNNAAILRTVCKDVILVDHQGQIPGAIHRAFRLAKCGEPGPVGVMIPYNLLTLSWDYDCPVPPPMPVPFDEGAYRRALVILSDRRRKVGIYAGLGCADHGPALAAVAEALQAPVATSVSGKGAISDGHPLAVGWGYGGQGTKAAEKTFEQVDTVLAIGVRYSEVSTANDSMPQSATLVHVDINPSNLNRNMPTCVAVNADAGLFLGRLLGDANHIARPVDPGLARAIHVRRQEDRAEFRRERITGAVDPMLFLVHLRRALGVDDLIFVDVTTATHWAAEAVEVAGPRRYFTPANNQSMGWAIPAAIGAQRVRPECRVASVVGDGCFLMSGLEASTAAREGLPVKFFVLDDGSYHYMQMLQRPTYRRTTATEIARLDYASLARGLGLAYNQIGRNEDLAAGVSRAICAPGPVLTRICISYEGREVRWLKALKGSYIDELSTEQKARMLGRIAARSLNRRPDND